MKKGNFNHREILKLAKMYQDLDGLLSLLPKGVLYGDEKATAEHLVISRNSIGSLLRWQSHSTWLTISK